MNRLKGMTAYLCGAMDRVKDGGVKWRQYMTPKLQELGVGVLDPCDKPSDYGTEDHDTRDQITKLKKSGKYDQVSEIMKPICAIDLRMVDIAHFIVMSLDVDSHLCGSYHEASVAIAQKKPVLYINYSEKIHNEFLEKIDLPTVEDRFKEDVGTTMQIDQLNELKLFIKKTKDNFNKNKEKINSLVLDNKIVLKNQSQNSKRIILELLFKN